MRVLAVGNMYPPHHLGGYELVWRSAMRHLRARGHQARVLTTDYERPDAGPDDPDTYRDLRWYWRDHAWPSYGWRARVALERHNAAVLDEQLRDFAPDVVSWWSMGGMSLSMIERVRRDGTPAVAFVHDDWLVYGPHVDRWTRAFRGRARALLVPLAERVARVPARVELERAARYVFVSETVRAGAENEGYLFVNSAIAPSGIDLSYLDPLPEHSWGWRLLFVGRLDERKGVDDAIAALSELPEEATLTVAGTGNAAELARARSQAVNHGVATRVRLLGMRTRAELRSAYEACDVVVFPVRWREPWGLVPLEAMAHGRPVVATAIGGPSEYLRAGENGLIIEPQDPASIARAVRWLADDKALRTQLRAGGLRTAARHTEAGFNEAVERALEQALR